ncbi:MAG: phage holin family protein [Bacilli bacterium]|nr:phage holin family protein [Bacilli bacterium]
MEILNYIIENRLILIPVLYIIGEFIKKTKTINNRWIPLILMVIGVVFSILMSGDKIINNIIQGVLVSGVTVLGNQIIKQIEKDDENEM